LKGIRISGPCPLFLVPSVQLYWREPSLVFTWPGGPLAPSLFMKRSITCVSALSKINLSKEIQDWFVSKNNVSLRQIEKKKILRHIGEVRSERELRGLNQQNKEKGRGSIFHVLELGQYN
jgi:hypothetical protein